MPIWDSVQRGLEKASQEAARMARTQRQRSTMENTARQMNALSSSIVNKTMELFISGQITHPELLPLCHELEMLRQQYEQMQNEVQQMQAQIQAQGQLPPGASPYPPPMGSNPAFYPSTLTDAGATQFAPPPPDYPSYMGSTNEDLTPPPPPDIAGAPVSAYSAAQPITNAARCPACGYEIQPNHSFCQRCGTRILSDQQGYQPTARGSSADPSMGSGSNEATVLAPQSPVPPAPNAPDQNQGG
jgi:DNA-directed RNA polymerase subunit RPC12/RpoP